MKAYYTAQIDTLSCCYKVRINDIEVEQDQKGFATSVEYPINQWILNGINTLSVNISPCIGSAVYTSNSKCDIIIFVRDKDEDREQRREVAKVSFQPFDTDEKCRQGRIRSSTTFNALMDLPPHTWVSTDPFNMKEAEVAGIIGVYRQFHDHLKTNNIDGLMKLTALRDKEMAVSFYYDHDEYLDRIKGLLTKQFERSGNQLIELDVQMAGIRPYLYHFGKLITLKNDEDNSPLFFYNEEDRDETYFDIMLCNSNGIPIIVR